MALVEQLERCVQERCGGTLAPLFVGNPHRIEGRVIPERGYRFVPIPLRGFYGITSARSYGMLWRLPVSLWRVWRAFRQHRPRLAVLAGTYVSLPVGIVAALSGVPIVLLEINAVPGKVNRLLSRWAARVLVSFRQCQEFFPARVRERVVVTGTPVRRELTALPERAAACRSFGLDPARPVLLVLGGSLGARSINCAVAGVLDRILSCGWQVLWQTGPEAPHCEREGVVQLPFIHAMASAYAAAELAISRAGGSTVAELACCGVPAVLVPYPHAANHEQHRNAEALAAAGGAIVVEDSALEEQLWSTLEPLLANPERRRAMRQSLRRIGCSAAAREAAQVVAELLGCQ